MKENTSEIGFLQMLEALERELGGTDLSGNLRLTLNHCRDCVHNRELHLAFEDLVTNLDEFEVPISADLYRQIEAIGRGLSVDESQWSDLKAYIRAG